MKTGAKKWIAFDFDVASDSTSNPTSSSKSSPKKSTLKSNPTKTLKRNTDVMGCIDRTNIKITETVSLLENFKKKGKSSFNLLESLRPKLVEDLAVHQKKIKEVEAWLQQNVIASSYRPFSPILLLTGPTGSGKTATVNVLCKVMGIKLSEWVNPVDQDSEISFGQAQISKFTDFFTQSKYNSLCDDSTNKKVALVEDFPNFVTYNPSEFVGILEKCYNGSTPVIFICTDASSSKLDLCQTLFPLDTREKFHITNISFNPCSATLLKNALRRAHNLIQTEPDLFRVVPSDIIEAIISSTMGDIRCAVNQYHFACLKGTTAIPTVVNKNSSRGAKRKRNEKPTSSIKSMARDETLGFFHGLGRVLNPKRMEVDSSWRIQCDFDALIDQFSTQPSIFSGFLQENYLKYFGDLNDVQKAADILSQAQVFLDKWTDRHDILVYALWVSVLGLMVFNEHKVSKWNQINAPTKVKRVVENTLDSRCLTRSDYFYYNLITSSNKYHTFKS